MKKIIIETSDHKIWNLEEKILDLVKSMINNESIMIDLNNEGPCIHSLGLYSLLDSLCESFNYDSDRITIITINPLEKNSKYNIICKSNHFVSQAQKLMCDAETSIKKFDSNFKHFGMFIGRQNWQRLWIASQLDVYYSDKTIMTYLFSINEDYHRKNSDLDKLLDYIGLDDLQAAVNFLQKTPIKAKKEITEWPIPDPEHYDVIDNYSNFFVDIVCETYFTGNTFFPNEKTWRPIMMRTPFIIQGPANFLNNLKKLGFKTFDKWWSEDYQDFNKLPIDCELQWSTIEILKILNNLSQKSVTELKQIYEDMTPVLNHNYERLQELNPAMFLAAFEK